MASRRRFPEPRTEPRSQTLDEERSGTADGSLPRSRSAYRTGNSYPGDPTENENVRMRGPEHRDIYGENDPLPEVEEGQITGAGAPALEPDETRAGPPLTLVVIGGPDRGMTRRFVSPRMVVGRSPGCAIFLKDTSVSRRHVELIRTSSGVFVRDLGSGNGTRVNGQPITEGMLKHSDIIEVGQSKLQFVDETEQRKEILAQEERRKKEEEEKKADEAAKLPAAPVQEPPAAMPPTELTSFSAAKVELADAVKRLKRRHKIALGALIAAVAGVLFIGLPLLLRPAPPPAPPLREVMAEKKLDLAQLALAEGRYSDALDLLDAADRLSPGPDKEGLKQRIGKEASAHRALDNARSLVLQNKFDEAWNLLSEVPEASPQLAREKKALESELDTKQSEYLETSVDQALSRLDIEAAKELIGRLPEDRQERYRAKLSQAQATLEEQQRVQKQQAALEKELAQQREQAMQQARMEAMFRGVERKFNQQEFDRAILECDRVMDESSDPEVHERAVALKHLIPQFYRSWMDGQRKFKEGAMEGARVSLKRAQKLYQEIHLPGMLAAELDEQLLQATLSSGNAALMHDELAAAAVIFQDALAQSPKESQAEEGLRRVERRTIEIYHEAYMGREKDPEEAISKFELILKVAPKDSLVYQKAKQQLRALRP